MNNPNRRQFKKRGGGKKRINNNTGAPNRATDSRLIQPRLKPVVHFSRTVVGLYNIVCDGINPSLASLQFNLSALPNFTDYTNLFQSYRLNKIKIQWDPEYTELTDAALVSNAVNVKFNSVIDQTDPAAPTSVGNVTQYQTNKATGITKQHTRIFEPAMLTSSSMPCNCYLSTTNPNERHYGVKVGVDPTGVAMTFRSTVTIWFECAGSR
jgi:hypothetical protein